MRSTLGFQPSPSNLRINVGRVWLWGVLVSSGWAACSTNADGFVTPSTSQDGQAGGAGGPSGGLPDAEGGGSPALDAANWVALDGAFGGSLVPRSSSAEVRDAGSSLRLDASAGDMRGTTGTGGVGGQGTAPPDAGTTSLDAPEAGRKDSGGQAGGKSSVKGSGGAATGGMGGGLSNAGGTTGGSKGGATSGTLSHTPDAGLDGNDTPDALVSLDTREPDATVDASSWSLLWSDEFNREKNAGIDSDKWTVLEWESGRVNGEKQRYVDNVENLFFEGNKYLVLRGLHESGDTYTSARIESKFKFKFGRVEVSAKLPAGQGSFPGIIMMGTNGGWPDCGELALMEQYGDEKDRIYCSTYSGSQSDIQKTFAFPSPTSASAEFHTYAVEWYTDHVVFFVDETEVGRKSYSASSPFANDNNDFTITLDVALGGDMGRAIDNEAFPMDMVVDYVRVYSAPSARRN